MIWVIHETGFTRTVADSMALMDKAKPEPFSA
jgi:ABC-type polar amino acid transport system ATPase subunit